MTNNKPEVVAWYTPATRYTLPVVALDDRSQRGEPLIRLSDYEALQAAYEKLLKHLQSLIDQTTPLVPEPGNPMWSRRIKLDEVIAERDSLRAECESLQSEFDSLVEALELISDTDPDEGTAWFHEVANKALAAHRSQGGK